MPGPGAFGPYERHGKTGPRWIVKIRAVSGGAGTSHSFATKGAAEAFAADHRSAVEATITAGRTVADALDAYARHLDAERHKQRVETIRRVRLFFSGHEPDPIRSLTAVRCQRLYEAVCKRKAERWVGSGEKRHLVKLEAPLSVNSQRGIYTHSKTFLRWCVERRWLRSNPLAAVKPRGKLRHGQAQLRIDEARKFYQVALVEAEKEAGALAAVTALLLGLRASEITQRKVRDLDDGGRLLWIPDSKTAAGRRTVEVPETLRKPLRKLAKGRIGEALLFGGPHLRGWVLYWTKAICRRAELPEVSAHSLRGLHTSLALRAGVTSHVVAEALGHASDAVTLGSYAAPGAAAAGRQARTLGILTGGRGRRR